KGNRQKVALISALASDVEPLLLDEPTAGLDPLMESACQHTIREMKDAGRTGLLSRHVLAQVEALADRIAIVRQGRIRRSGRLAERRHMTRTTIAAETDRPAQHLAELPGVHDLTEEHGTVQFQLDGDRTNDAMQALAALGVQSLVAHPP